MYIEPLERQMAVCSFDGAARLTALDKGYWNVVSINGPREQKASLRFAKAIHYACFDDLEDATSAIYRSPREADIVGILSFIRSLGSNAPIMIHCQQGISRSAAVALAWIYAHLPQSDDRSLKAIDLLLELRPQAKPNRLVLTLGLSQFISLEKARLAADQMLSDPRVLRNRFQSPQFG